MATNKTKATAKDDGTSAAKKKANAANPGGGTTSPGFDSNNRMHEFLFLVLSYLKQFSLSADFQKSGERQLSSLPYWLSRTDPVLQKAAAITFTDILVVKMAEWFKLTPKAGSAKTDWKAAAGAIEALMTDATKHTAADLGDAFSENYMRAAS